MASVRSIAKLADVSIATVSRALNNDRGVAADVRDRVTRIANELNYASPVGKKPVTNIGLVYATGGMSISEFDGQLLHGISLGLRGHRFDVTLIDLVRDKEPGESYTQFFMRKSLRGAIIRTSSEYRQMVREIAAEGIAHVVVAERFEDDPAVNFMGYDSRADSRRAVEHLIGLGHRRVALGMMNADDHDHADRLAGYRVALREAGIGDECVIRLVPDLDGGASAINRLMASPPQSRPTAIYFTDPPAAVGALRRALELGVRVPEELSIVGFDDGDSRRRCHPKMTAVCQDAVTLGRRAAEWLMQRLGNRPEASCRDVLETFFEVNQTTGPVDARASTFDTKASTFDAKASMFDANASTPDRDHT